VSESLSPAPAAPAPWEYTGCGCGCRSSAAEAPGCACKECQPGPGIDYLGNRHRLTTIRKVRMNFLLSLNFERLTQDEKAELDDLLSIYLHTPYEGGT
jgi:hypothetical protein